MGATMAKPKKPARDRHKSTKVLRIPDDIHGALARMAAANDRPIVREAIRGLIKHLREGGFWPEDATNE